MRIVLVVVVGVSVLSMVGTTFVATLASRENYPGGVALEALHQAIDEDTSVKQRVGGVRGVLFSKREMERGLG